MGWRSEEVWLDVDVLWFGERSRPALALAGAAEAGLLAPVETGLERSRRRRLEAQAARRRRLATRTVPAVALVLGSSAMLPLWVSRHTGGGPGEPLAADPPSLTFRLEPPFVDVPEAPVRRPSATSRTRAERTAAPPAIEWNEATSVGLQFYGRLEDGTQLPVEGPDWSTWNPNTDSVPNAPGRLYGHERTIRAILAVAAAHRAAHPDAPRLLVGDISFPEGGRMDGHRSHQNGLDVDVYYPRLDGRVSAPAAAAQVDRHLAQDLLDRFLAAGAKVVFVGYSTGLHGPPGVVVPYPNHENHMHVRFGAPA